MHADAWLAERIGRPAFTLEEADDGSDVGGPAFLQAKVSCADVERVSRLEAAGMRVVDVNVTLRREAGPSGVAPSNVTVRDAVDADRDAVGAIAEHEYDVSRFHLDPEFPDDVAGRIKRDWTTAFFDGKRGDRLLVAELGDRVVGFHLVVEQDAERVIDLIAVTAEVRGAGAGTALVAALLDAEPLKPVVVGTQASNTGATRLYERLGFTVAETRYVLHRMVS